ncbi:hypothetical protein [Actinokineospora enzanensis]|uniref:hypothetical protein n=1 Tax=Actinokineospora enzanensis TaxID=155975 RepID=UPI0003AA4523|nr:hypothetical protein [Actinokineospora enzanensis]
MTRFRVQLKVCAVLLAVAAVGAYALGLLDFLVSEADEACARGLVYEGSDFREMRTGLLPLENTCVFVDGTTYDDVPPWVNPVFFGGLAGSAACVATLVWTTRRTR